MDPRPEHPNWLPAEREPQRPPAVAPPPPGTPPPAGQVPRWRRLVRSPRGAAGLAILAAALLLWPFANWSVIPWLVGIGLLVVLRLLRLDGLLRGWALHLGGFAVVLGLMYSTGPWAWAFAVSIGVLLAGLVMLPRWKVVAIGAVLCVVSGVGFGISRYQTAQEVAAAEAQAQRESQGRQGAARPQGVLPVLLNRIAENVPGPVCDNLLSEAARAAFTTSTGQTDCAAAVAALSARITDRTHYASGRPRTSEVTPDGLAVNACSMTWPGGSQAGPALGQLTIGRKAGGSTYIVTAFLAC